MKNKMARKAIMAAMVGTLCIGTATTAFAAPMGGGRGGQRMEQGQNNDGGRPDFSGGDMNGERPYFQGGFDESERPELPENLDESERPELPENLDESERPELPDNLDESERPELPEGVEEGDRPERPEGMEDFKGGERPERPEGDEDLEDGERPERPEGMEDDDRHGRHDGERMELPEGAVNIEAYKSALEGVEDEDTAASLQEYIDALEEALDAERTALDSEDELGDDELAAYQEAVSEANQALKDAFADAGIEVSDEMPEMGRRDGDRDELPEGVAGNKPLDGEQDGSKETINKRIQDGAEDSVAADGEENFQQDNARANGSKSEGNNNVFTQKLNQIYNWFKGLFK